MNKMSKKRLIQRNGFWRWKDYKRIRKIVDTLLDAARNAKFDFTEEIPKDFPVLQEVLPKTVITFDPDKPEDMLIAELEQATMHIDDERTGRLRLNFTVNREVTSENEESIKEKVLEAFGLQEME